MPTYDYRCEACGKTLELFQSMLEAPKRKCPSCKKLKLKRQIGRGGAILFKGSGFYQTDYRSEGYKSAAKAEGSPAKDTAEKATPESSPKSEGGGQKTENAPQKKDGPAPKADRSARKGDRSQSD